MTKGTVRVLTALVVFPLTWWAIAAFDVGAGWISGVLTAVTFPLSPVVDVVVEARSGFWGSLVVFLAAPVFGLAAVRLLERWRDLVDAWLDWAGEAVVDRRGQLADVMALRAEVVATVSGTDQLTPPDRSGQGATTPWIGGGEADSPAMHADRPAAPSRPTTSRGRSAKRIPVSGEEVQHGGVVGQVDAQGFEDPQLPDHDVVGVEARCFRSRAPSTATTIVTRCHTAGPRLRRRRPGP